MREPSLNRPAIGLILAIGLALFAWLGYNDIKYSPPLRQVYFWIYNAGHPPLDPEQLGDGGQKKSILFGNPSGLAEDKSGNIFVSDRGRSGRGRVIWKLDDKGTARIVAGTGRRGSALANSQARNSDLGSPEGLCVDSAGRLYFADAYSHVVSRIELDGRLTRIAGTGSRGYNGDGMPATASRLNSPYGVDIDSQGNLYIADTENNRIRKVTNDGTIHTVAGTGEAGFDVGDGKAIKAIEVRLNRPYGVAVDAEDRLYIADSYNHVIRRVNHDGTINTVAGVGEPGYAGDGGPGRLAVLNTPQALAFDKQGRLLIGDEHNHSIRVVDLQGHISTFMGNGVPGFATEGQLAMSSQLNDPEDLLIRADGTLLIVDSDNYRVLMIGPEARVWSFAGRGVTAQDGE